MEKIRKTWLFRKIRGISRFLWYGDIGRKDFFIYEPKKLIYINMPKVACSSIKQSFATGGDIENPLAFKNLSRLHIKNQLSRREKKYWKFTFVRNPFDRLVSCYVHKIERGKEALRKNYITARIDTNETFDSFARKVARIPDALADWHFRSQYSMLARRGKLLPDYIGHFEHLAEEFEPIRQKYNLQPLPHIHKMNKKDWREYYTPELARVVYERYKDDFEKLGYEDEYEKLLKYLSSD